MYIWKIKLDKEWHREVWECLMYLLANLALLCSSEKTWETKPSSMIPWSACNGPCMTSFEPFFSFLEATHDHKSFTRISINVDPFFPLNPFFFLSWTKQRLNKKETWVRWHYNSSQLKFIHSRDQMDQSSHFLPSSSISFCFL